MKGLRHGEGGLELRVRIQDQARPTFEWIPVRAVGLDEFLVARSPGMVLGVARGDRIRASSDAGTFIVLERSGNLAIQLLRRRPAAHLPDPLFAAFSEIVSSLDGSIDGYSPSTIVATVPVDGGFEALEEMVDGLMNDSGAFEWMIGNLYPEDGSTRVVRWWRSFTLDDPKALRHMGSTEKGS